MTDRARQRTVDACLADVYQEAASPDRPHAFRIP
jgi:hypothetical protein